MLKNSKVKITIFISSIFIVILSLFLNFNKTSAISTIEKGKLIVGTNATFAPFEYKSDGGEIVGFDVDLIKEIAKEINLNVEIVDMPFDALLSAVGTKIDLVIAGLTATEERKQQVNFSHPYFEGRQFILTLKEKEIKKEEDFKNFTTFSLTYNFKRCII